MYKILVITPVHHITGLAENLEEVGDIDYLNDPTEEDILKISKDYDAIYTNPNKSKFFIGEKIIDKFPSLKSICTASTGTNHIDVNYADSKNIKIISLTNEMQIIEKISSTAEHAFSLMLSSLRNIPESFDDVKSGNWNYEPFIGRQLNYLNIGIIGFGRLGKKFAKYANGFDANVIAYDPLIKIKDENVKQVNLNELLNLSDIITLHVHVNNSTIKMLNKSNFKMMKKNVIIINTSRGEIVDENDLMIFLKSSPDAKYACDVLSNEQNKNNKNELINFSKISNQILITPHIAGMTVEGQYIAYNHAVKMLKNYLKGK